MNLEITIRVPITSGDAGAVTVETSDTSTGRDVDTGVAASAAGDDDGGTPVGTTNGHGPEQQAPPSLEELGIAVAGDTDGAPPGPPDVALLLAPAAAPDTGDGPPPLSELGLTDDEGPPPVDAGGALSSTPGTVARQEHVPGPPSIEELEQQGAAGD